VALQVGEDRVYGVDGELDAVRRERHRRLELTEAAQPRRRQIDPLLTQRRVSARRHLEAGRIDEEAGRAVAPQGLEVIVERERVVDVRRAEPDLAAGAEG